MNIAGTPPSMRALAMLMLLMLSPVAEARRLFDDVVVQMLPLAQAVGDGTTQVSVGYVVLDTEGEPISGLSGKLSASGGQTAPLIETRAGLYVAQWTPPVVERPVDVTLELKLKGPNKTSLVRSNAVPVTPAARHRVSLSVDPPAFILGQHSDATVTIRLRDGGASLREQADFDVVVTAGTLSEPQHQGDGVYLARYEPPERNYPHVALIGVVDKRHPDKNYAVAQLPLLGKINFPVSGVPNSDISLVVGEKTFGPVKAGADGRARVPIIVSPGIERGTVRSALGEDVREEPLDLKPPSFQRVTLLPFSQTVPADGMSSVFVRAFVVEPTGEPDEGADVSFSTTTGSVGETINEGGGLYAARFTPDVATVSGTATVQVSVRDDASSQGDAMSVAFTPARASALSLSPVSQFPEANTTLDVRITGRRGRGLAGQQLLTDLQGARVSDIVPGAAGDYALQLAVDGERVSGVIAAQPNASGNPLEHLLVVPSQARVAPNGSTRVGLVIVTADRFGYPVANQGVNLVVGSGDGTLSTSQVITNDGGMAVVDYTVGTRPGLAAVYARSGQVAGAGGFLQYPPDVAEDLRLPVLGSVDVLRHHHAWQRATVAFDFGPEGFELLSPPPNTVGRVLVTTDPKKPAPGMEVTVDVRVEGLDGNPRPGQDVWVQVPVGAVAPVEDLGGGNYRSIWVIPEDATGDLTLSAGSGGQTAHPSTTASGSAPVLTPATPSGDAPIRILAGWTGGFHSYTQTPYEGWTELWQNDVRWGSQDGGEAVSARAAGLVLSSRGVVPQLSWLGWDGRFRTVFYAVDLAYNNDGVSGEARYNNSPLDLSVAAVPRYTMDSAVGELHAGLRVGWSYASTIIFRSYEPDNAGTRCVEPCSDSIDVHGALLGIEVGAELEDFGAFGSLSVDTHLHTGKFVGRTFYEQAYRLQLGKTITSRVFGAVGFEGSNRSINVIAAEETDESGEVVVPEHAAGVIDDSMQVLYLSVGYQL